MVFKYKHVIVAGTFDGLHSGHKQLLQFAFSVGEHVYVTITSDIYTKNYKPNASSFEKRKRDVERFLLEENLLRRAMIMPINDGFGIAIDKSLPIDALIVTSETFIGGEKVNAKRESLGLSPLKLVVTPVTIGETGLRISSSHLKTGIINERGEIDIKREFMNTTLLLPDTLRQKLQKPFGSVVQRVDMEKFDPQKLIAVGDVTTKVLHEAHVLPALSLIDFVVERQNQQHDMKRLGITSEIIVSAENPHSSLTPSLWNALEKSLILAKEQKRVVIVVEGEEDLAVLPLLLLAPKNWVICYGQPRVGMIAIPVTESSKEQAITILSQFKRQTTRGH